MAGWHDRADARLVADAMEGFRRLHHRAATVAVRAPGRVNLIGDHTDYTGGFVLPMAIQFQTIVAAGRRSAPGMSVFANAYQAGAKLPPEQVDPLSLPHWARYVYGVREVLRSRGVAMPDADLYIVGDVPLGAGLASSASLEVACGLAMVTLAEAEMPPIELASACRRAENEYAGSPCGIMDQAISACGQAGCALRIDCRDLSLHPVPLRLPETRFVVVDTGVRHSIAAGEYARRRSECESALAALRDADPELVSFRDVDEAVWERLQARLGGVERRRARHIVTENRRVIEACGALHRGDAAAFGFAMFASHASLRDDFEVSCEELDAVVDTARATSGVLGARMTGGGFGGCAIVLLERECLSAFSATIQSRCTRRFAQPFGITPVTAEDGATVIYKA
ncbi:MAG: galactokinase [Phycisphaerales bacterium]|nr:galactokinase [Phycisphaerales bacterium]